MRNKLAAAALAALFASSLLAGCYRAGKVTGEAVKEIKEGIRKGKKELKKGYQEGRN